MALNDENGGGFNVSMPVAPAAYGYGMPYMGGNNGGLFGNGGDSWLGILFLIALCNGGFGFGGFGGWGGMGMMNGMWGMGIDYLYPWLNNSEHISDGFRDQQLSSQVGNIQNAITSGFGDVQTSLCSGFAGVNATINGAQNAISQQLYSNQLADLERSYAAQTATTAGMNGIAMNLQNCCCENRAATADLKYTVATEACADRAAISDALRDVIAANTASTQRILDQLCADKIESKNDTIAQLRSELMYARGQASQDVQTAAIRASQATTANQLVAELRSCPIPAQPVYGNQPIFSCPQTITPGCGCGCGA